MKKVVILGPESTGKTTLAKNLSIHFNTDYVPEFARSYLDVRLGQYKQSDLLEIAQGQIASEDEIELRNSDLIFYDTDIAVIKIWSEYKYGNCNDWILEEYIKRKYDLYLLTFPDLPWEPDTQRENPKDLLELFNIYQKDLENRKVNFKIVAGLGDDRFKVGLNHVNRFLAEQ